MSERRAYEVTLPNGILSRFVSTRDITHCVMSRTDKTWKASWFAGRNNAERQVVRFASEMLHRSGLRPDQYEAHAVPVTGAVPPPLVYVHLLLPGRRRAKMAYCPAWGEAPPIAVLAVGDGAGWQVGSWVTSREQLDREVRRLKKLHDQVTVVEVRARAAGDAP